MLERLFFPKSIAVVGASRTPGKLGHDVIQNVKQLGYQGVIFPVNPHAERIEGLPCFASLADIKNPVDVVVIVVPAPAVKAVMRDCGRAKVRFAVIISAGFRETGASGARLEQEIKEIARRSNVRIIGPNCLGYLNTANRLNASFASGMPLHGKTALISQSGAMGVAMLDWAYQSRFGFSKILSIGNKVDIDEVDCLNYFAKDPDTEVIMIYAESIAKGRAFLDAAARVTPRKPLLLLKAGASRRAVRAATSHTGALAGSEEALDAAVRRSGIIRPRTIEEFFDDALAFSHAPLPKNDRIAIITNAGGPAIMAVDAVAQSAVQLPLLSAGLQRRLRQRLPVASSTQNPIDLLGDADPGRYAHALRVVLSSVEIDGAIVILTPQVMTDEDTTAETVAKIQKEHRKPILASFMGGVDVNSGRVILETNGIPNYDTPERAVKAMSQLIRYQKTRKAIRPLPKPPRGSARRLPVVGRHPELRTLEAERFLSAEGMPVLRSTFLRTEKACEQLTTFPLVMKVASRDVIHKAAAGAVVLGIENVQQAKEAFRRITRSVRKLFPKAEIEGMLVQPQLQREGGLAEVIIGMKRDAQFGPVMMVGLGGGFVEVFQDVTFGIAPLSLAEAKEMIQRIRGAQLLESFDTAAAARVLVDLSRWSFAFPGIHSCDINPMILFPKKRGSKHRARGGMIVDVRMMV